MPGHGQHPAELPAEQRTDDGEDGHRLWSAANRDRLIAEWARRYDLKVGGEDAVTSRSVSTAPEIGPGDTVGYVRPQRVALPSPFLRLRPDRQELRHFPGSSWHRPSCRRRRVHLLSRPFGVRKIDVASDHRRARSADLRAVARRRAVTSRARPPAERRFGILFQSYAWFPNLNVYDNVVYGPGCAGRKRSGRT